MYANSSQFQFLVYSDKNCSLSGGGEGDTFTKGNLCPAFRQVREGNNFSCICWFSIVFSEKKSLCQSGIFWGGIFWFPSSYNLKIVKFAIFSVFSSMSFLFLFFRFYFFILDIGEGKEKEKERNINVWLPLTCPLLGTWPATQAFPPTGNWTSNPVTGRPALSPLSHTSQVVLWVLTNTYSGNHHHNQDIESFITTIPKFYMPYCK